MNYLEAEMCFSRTILLPKQNLGGAEISVKILDSFAETGNFCKFRKYSFYFISRRGQKASKLPLKSIKKIFKKTSYN
jgi:hypothetical protein